MNNIFNFLASDVQQKSRVIWAIVILVLFMFIILGVIGMIIHRIMRWQGKAVDKLMYNVTVTRVIQNKKHFIRIANIKSSRYFFKQAWIPFLLLLVSGIFILLFYVISQDWDYNIWGNFVDANSAEGEFTGGTGISTLFFIWDYSKMINKTDAGLLLNWPPLINTPHFSGEAWASYVFFAFFTPGTIWFLVVTQCYIARFARIRKLANSIYDKNLGNFKFDTNTQYVSGKNRSLEDFHENENQSTD